MKEDVYIMKDNKNIDSPDHHINSILYVAQCPKCHSSSWYKDYKTITCGECNALFHVKGFSVDFIDEASYQHLDDQSKHIYTRALENWGSHLHASEKEALPESWHGNDFLNHFGKAHNIYKGKVLEIGCGSGYDSHLTAKKNPDINYYAIDIGKNVYQLSKRDGGIKNLFYMRGDALTLPVMNSTFDSIISFGVFHHTPDPKRCMEEAYRVLRDKGSICIYLYKNHDDNILKYTGIQLEMLLMRLTSGMSIERGKLFCLLLSPLLLLIFSWPAQILKRIKPLEKVGRAFPLHWGTTPATIINDLQDRLMASINYRFSRKDFYNLFEAAGFSNIEVVTTTGGHYGYAEKVRV